MKPKLAYSSITQVIVVLAIAYALKAWYASVSVNELGWILAPTTFLVQLVTGETFTFESYAGYMSSDHSFLIAAACSGVNFFITAFVMLALVRLWKERNDKSSIALIPAALGAAYVVTILANTVRIAIALKLHQMKPQIAGADPEHVHRIEGIIVYFGALLLLYLVSEWLYGTAKTSPARLLILPLVIYWLSTIAVPFVNGAYRQEATFWAHSAFVFLVPLVLMFPLALSRWLTRFRSARPAVR